MRRDLAGIREVRKAWQVRRRPCHPCLPVPRVRGAGIRKRRGDRRLRRQEELPRQRRRYEAWECRWRHRPRAVEVHARLYRRWRSGLELRFQVPSQQDRRGQRPERCRGRYRETHLAS